uniref:Uncharacterized protein n=1 Tax=Caenorhabditis japonica TaxID=281687 RepID=A0A8R1EAY3_CAEJA
MSSDWRPWKMRFLTFSAHQTRTHPMDQLFPKAPNQDAYLDELPWHVRSWRSAKVQHGAEIVAHYGVFDGTHAWASLSSPRKPPPFPRFSFKICIDASNHDSNTGIPVCKRYAEIFVLPQQGVVIWPGSGRASLIDMKTKHYGEFDTFAIEVGYGVSASSGKLSSENSHPRGADCGWLYYSESNGYLFLNIWVAIL